MHVFLSVTLLFAFFSVGLGQNQGNNVNNVNQGANNAINSNAINVNSVMNNGNPNTGLGQNQGNNVNNVNQGANNVISSNSINVNSVMNNANPNTVGMGSAMPNMALNNMNPNMNITNLTNMMNMINNTMPNVGTMNNGSQQQQNLNVGNPDRGRIERPCETFDTDCIRKFFAERNKCKIVRGPIPDPFYRKQSVVYLPRVNLTLSLYDIKLTGLNRARIEDFYINLDTDKIVLAVEIRNLTVASNRTYFRFHRRGKEPVITKTTFTANYPSLSLTGIIPQIDHSQLDRTVVYPYTNTMPNYQFGPNAFVSTDPQTQATAVEYAANPQVNTAEILLTDSTYYLIEYIQYKICDFGLKVL